MTDVPLLSGPTALTDAEGDSVSQAFAPMIPYGTTFAASGLPGGLSIDPWSGLVTGVVGYANATPTTDGVFSVVISALHGGSVVGTHTVEWTVTDTNRLNLLPGRTDDEGAGRG